MEHSLSLIYSLSGYCAVVSGASQGIGRAIAETFAQQGASVTILARSKDLLREVYSGLPRPENQSHSLHAVDLTDIASLQGTLDAITTKGTVHIVVNNSGGPAPGAAHEADKDQFINAIQGHLLAYQQMLQSFLPGMREANYGRVINILSTSVVTPLKGLGVSNTLRAAVANWGKTLADELGTDGITVNNILPGMTATERLSKLFKHKAEKQGVPLSEIESASLAKIPAGRFGRPEEIAAAVAFLASPAASYINGVNLPVDGGRLASQ